MRILFSCRPAFGHVYPLMPLAFAARDAGHEVVFGTGEKFVPRLTKLGFQTHKVGIAVSEAEAEANRQVGGGDFMTVGMLMFAELLPRATLADLTPLLPEVRPDLVVYEQSDIGAAAAAQRAGIPCVSHVIGRSLPEEIRQLAAERMNWLWDGDGPADPMLGDVSLDIWPAGIADAGSSSVPHRIELRPTPWNEPAPMPSIVTAERVRPLVYLTLGTVAFGAVEVIRAAIDGLADLPVDVLVAAGPGDPAALGSVPDSVHVERFVPQAEILPHVDLVVHHGGSGTVLGASANGLPQLILPQGADQFANAEVMAKHGAGMSLVGVEITPSAITDRAMQLIENSAHGERAQELSAEIAAMPTPHDVLPALVELAE